MYGSLFRNLLYPGYEQLRRHSVGHWLKQYQHNLTLSPEQLQQQQLSALQNLLEHCLQQIPFYRQHWRSCGLESGKDLNSLHQFSLLPPLTKQLVTAHYPQLVTQLGGQPNIKKSTGGSTGEPFHFELDQQSNQRRQAVMWRGYGWLGAGLGERTLQLWGADIGYPSWQSQLKNQLYHRFYNRTMLSSFEMQPDNLGSYLNRINRIKPKVMVAYTNPLYQLARFILQAQVQVHQPQAILTGAEPLEAFQRQTIQEAFKAPVFNTYGCREFMLIAAECQQQHGLHINSDHLVVETVDEQGKPLDGEPGDLLITDLYNYGMPLVRYQNGDRGILSHRQCSCGNPLPMLESVTGRKLDMLKTRSGKLLPGELFPHLFKEFREIYKFQVRQPALDRLEIALQLHSPLSSAQITAIQQEITRYTQGELQLNFQFVDQIPLTASGKHRVTICEI